MAESGDPQARGPPIPDLDSAECWLPPDEQLLKSTAEGVHDVDSSRFVPTKDSVLGDDDDASFRTSFKGSQRGGGASDPNGRFHKTTWAIYNKWEGDGPPKDSGPQFLSPRDCQTQSKKIQQIESPAEVLLAGLKDILSYHREEFGTYIEKVLSEHHDNILQRLEAKAFRPTGISLPLFNAYDQQQQPGQTGGAASVASPFGSMIEVPVPRASRGSVPGADCSRSTAQAVDGRRREHREVDMKKCSFEEHEHMKQLRSRRQKSSHFPGAMSSGHTVDQALGCCRNRVLGIVEAQWFEGLVCFLIIANVCFLGYEVQCMWGVSEKDVPQSYNYVEMAFAACFTLEVIMRLLAWDPMWFFCGDNKFWNTLDLSLVTVSWLELMLEFFETKSVRVQYVRIIRLLRTTRIIRLVRIMKFFRPLRILVYSLANTLRSLVWVLVLLVLIIYLFAVLFTVAASNYVSTRDSYDPNMALVVYFGSLWSSTSSLFKAITGGLDWQVCVDALKDLHIFWRWILMAYVAVANFGILNVVTGVVCQTAMESAQQDHDIVIQSQLNVKQRYVKQLQDLFAAFDNNHTGHITLEEFEERLAEGELKNYFLSMDLSVDEAWNFFKLLDNGDQCMIDVEEFVSGCLRLRGQARSIDVHMLIYQSRWTMKKLSSVMATIEDIETVLFGPSRASYLSRGTSGDPGGQMLGTADSGSAGQGGEVRRFNSRRSTGDPAALREASPSRNGSKVPAADRGDRFGMDRPPSVGDRFELRRPSAPSL